MSPLLYAARFKELPDSPNPALKKPKPDMTCLHQEDGVEFEDPKKPGSRMLLTPEKSIESQSLGCLLVEVAWKDSSSRCVPSRHGQWLHVFNALKDSQC